MAHGLEGGDRPPELDALNGVIARELQHRPRRPDQLVGQGDLSGSDGVGPCGRRARELKVTGHLDQAEGRIDSADGTDGDPVRFAVGEGERAQSPGPRLVTRPERWEDHRAVDAQGAAHDGVESRRGGVGHSLQLEERRHRCSPVDPQCVPPPELVEGVVEGLAGMARARLLQAGPEKLELLAVHQASAPRSSRRRATMLRWISALPP